MKTRWMRIHYIQCEYDDSTDQYIIQVIFWNGEVDTVARTCRNVAPGAIDRYILRFISDFRIFKNRVFGAEHGRFVNEKWLAKKKEERANLARQRAKETKPTTTKKRTIETSEGEGFFV